MQYVSLFPLMVDYGSPFAPLVLLFSSVRALVVPFLFLLEEPRDLVVAP